MSRTVTGERQPASDRINDFGGRQPERVQRGGCGGLVLTLSVAPGSYLGCAEADSKSADSRRSVGWDRDSRRWRIALSGDAVVVPRIRRKQSGLHRPCDPIGTDLGFREHPHPCSRAKNP